MSSRAKKPLLNPPSNVPSTTWAQRHGTSAQWASVIMSGIALLVAVCLPLFLRSVDKETKTSDEHINLLIATKLDDTAKAINQRTDQKLDLINGKIDELSEKIGDAQGQLKRLKGSPSQVLGKIRADIETATKESRIIPTTEMVSYKAAIHSIQPSSPEFWPTVAAVINYDSFVNQKKGHAPDPKKVSKVCPILTIGQNNAMIGGEYSNCIVNLDTQVFQGVTFKDSVIQYHGGTTTLDQVRFINCAFVLDLPPAPELRPAEKLLFALLDSPDQRSIAVSSN